MVIRINGREETVDRPGNLADLICGKGLIPEHVVVEHNFRIRPAGEWPGITLKDDDNIEIVSFVGGG